MIRPMLVADEPARTRLARKPTVIALFLACVIAVQASALATQFADGFLPLRAAPGRVAFSWDMFSIPIQRCGMTWEPKLAIGPGYETLRSLAPALEWDPVYNSVEDYVSVARLTCQPVFGATRVIVDCVTARGFEQHVIDCH
jgi:hypothetical protein